MNLINSNNHLEVKEYNGDKYNSDIESNDFYKNTLNNDNFATIESGNNMPNQKYIENEIHDISQSNRKYNDLYNNHEIKEEDEYNSLNSLNKNNDNSNKSGNKLNENGYNSNMKDNNSNKNINNQNSNNSKNKLFDNNNYYSNNCKNNPIKLLIHKERLNYNKFWDLID